MICGVHLIIIHFLTHLRQVSEMGTILDPRQFEHQKCLQKQ